MTQPVVWIKQLPREWKKIFDDYAAEHFKDELHGAGARMVERVLERWLQERGLI